MSAGKLLLAAATLAVVAAIAAAVMLEPPHRQREYRLDAHRVSDLAALDAAVNLYWKRHGALPTTLEALAAEPGLSALKDPETQAAYGYEITGSQSFRLCANFASGSRATDRYAGAPQLQWAHSAGRQCFDLMIKESAQRKLGARDNN